MNLIGEKFKKNRYMYLCIYFFSNIYFVFAYSIAGSLGGDFSNKYKSSTYSLIIACFFILLSWVFYIFIFNFFEKIKVKRLKTVRSKFLDYLMLLLAIVHLNGLINGFISPTANVERSVFYLLFNYIFTVDVLLLIYLFYNISKRGCIYYLNLILTIVIYLYSGRTGVFIFMLALLNLFFYDTKGDISLKKNLIFILIAFIIFPFIRSFKHYLLLTVISDKYRQLSFFDGFIQFWGESDFFVTYIKYFNETIERFEHVSNLSFVIDNIHAINSYLSNYDYIYINPTTSRIVANLLGYNSDVQFQFNRLIGGFVSKGETLEWNVPVGVPGIFFIDGLSIVFYFFVTILMVFLSVLISKSIHRDHYLIELSFLTMLLYVMHGWINDFLVYIFSLLLFYFIVLSSNLLKNMRKPRG